MRACEDKYPQPSLEIEETRPKDKHTNMYQDQHADAGGQKFGRPKNCAETKENRERSDKLLTTLLAVKLRGQK